MPLKVRRSNQILSYLSNRRQHYNPRALRPAPRAAQAGFGGGEGDGAAGAGELDPAHRSRSVARGALDPGAGAHSDEIGGGADMLGPHGREPSPIRTKREQANRRCDRKSVDEPPPSGLTGDYGTPFPRHRSEQNRTFSQSRAHFLR